jgi:polysaccharide chain length determinant protein (PEP-CTERM system associated)
VTRKPLGLQDIVLRICVSAWYRRYLIALPILIMPFVGAAVGMLAPKSYSARMTLLVQEPTTLNPFLDELAIPTGIKERMDALVEQMRIRSTVEEIARSLGWIDDSSSRMEIDQAVSKLRNQVQARLFGKEVVEISYQSADPNGMSDILRAFADHFTAKLLAPARSAVTESEHFLRGELGRYEQELALAEKRLAVFKSDNADSLPALHAENVRRLTSVREAISEKASGLSGHRARFNSVRSSLAQTNPIAARLDERITALRADLTLLRARYTDRHSAVQAALHELASLTAERQQLVATTAELIDGDLDSLWNMISSTKAEAAPILIGQLQLLQEIEGEIDRLVEELAVLREEERNLAERVRRFGKVEREINELEREVAAKGRLVEQLGQRFEMAKVTSALGAFSSPEMVRVIDQPQDPVAPSSLPVIIYVLAGLAGGISIGAGLAFTLELLDTRITTAEQIEIATGVPVLCRFRPTKSIDADLAIFRHAERIIRHAA